MVESVHNVHLAELLERVAQVMKESRELDVELSEEQRVWKPDPHRWSVLECFGHLWVTGKLYNPRIRETIQRARDLGLEETKPYRPGWLARKLIGFVSRDSKRRLKAPKAFRPTSSDCDLAGLQAFIDQDVEFEGLIREADGFELNKIKFASPISRLIRLSIGEGLTLMVTHQERHVHQAQALRELDGFPRDKGTGTITGCGH